MFDSEGLFNSNFVTWSLYQKSKPWLSILSVLSSLSHTAAMPLICRPIRRALVQQNTKSLLSELRAKSYINTRHQSNSSIQNASNQVIFSGIQPTGVPHLGNYLGALQQWVHLQNTSPTSTKLLYSVVDLHAITIPQNPGQLKQWKRESLATLLAVGLDEKRCGIFYQSSVGLPKDGR